MKTALARTAGYILAIAALLGCAVGAVMQPAPGLSTVTAILWLLGLGGAICLLLRRTIDADDRSRELAAQLARERGARQLADSMLADTQTVLSRVMRQQEILRDGERDRIARDIHDDLGQILLSLRVELSLLQVASNGVHPTVHKKTGAMVKTLDLALRSLRVVVNGLRPLGADEDLRKAMARQLDEFSRLHGIAHTFEGGARAEAGVETDADVDADSLLYRVLQEALANIAARASATEVHVRLQSGSAGHTLSIADNGAVVRAGGAGCGCGLSAMRTRIEALGGLLQVAADSAGTSLSLRLPARHAMPAL
ncbi:MAG: hypothetical protein V7631_3762 [Massilia sp.]|jgi:signal transduction histidine kinase